MNLFQFLEKRMVKNSSIRYLNYPKIKEKLPQVIEARIIPMEEQLSFISLLRQAKGKKPPAHPDEKRLLSHNSLVISAFIQASISLNDINLLEDAIRLENG